ncbi:MAG: glycerol-3-phosphate dehydrogenase/oxidase, partial [Myxococcales bacterium]|nr:glycerol-3-phosphate dehydrogenase/oxidase [Myxococcales bacterium]
RDTAMRGIRTLLLEKNDFAAATTGASSGMIHGGLRYLTSDVGTTELSCTDSGYIQKICPHLLFRIPFLAPVFEGAGGRAMIELYEAFFSVYDRYQPLKNGKPHTRLSREDALAIEPGLHPKILGAVTMDEYGIDAYRLVVANAVSAAEAGAKVLNHTEVTDFLVDAGKVLGVKTRDTLTGETATWRARIVFNATGPYGPAFIRKAGARYKLRPAKGVHITLERRISNVAVTATSIDGRQIFMIPQENTTIIGTTDDDYYGDLDRIPILEDEIEYLLQGMERMMPGIRRHRMVHAWAGVRPTLYKWGPIEDKLSREHEIYDHGERDGVANLFSMAGGKLASYRVMSEEAADLVAKRLGVAAGCATHTSALPGGDETPDARKLAEAHRLHPHAVARMIYRHGSRAREILEIVRETPRWGRLVSQTEPVTEAEVRYVIRKEWARTVGDIHRRCRTGGGAAQGGGSTAVLAQILGEELEL